MLIYFFLDDLSVFFNLYYFIFFICVSCQSNEVGSSGCSVRLVELCIQAGLDTYHCQRKVPNKVKFLTKKRESIRSCRIKRIMESNYLS